MIRWAPIALLALAAYLFWPIQRAGNAYSVADANYDRAGMCVHSREAAAAWAGLGFAGKSREWQSKADLYCAMAALGL